MYYYFEQAFVKSIKNKKDKDCFFFLILPSPILSSVLFLFHVDLSF